MNILIVNNEDAVKSAKKMDIDIPELRDLFYTKIPERLFYGLIRNLSTPDPEVRIKVDDATEYRTLKVYDNIKKQMNAHAAYRNKAYNVSSVLGKKSDYSIPLQIIDTFMGIIVFLMEELYYEDSISSKSRSDLIYRFLMESDNIIKFQKQITLYKWEGNEEKLIKIPISDYISAFLSYKTQYDVQQLVKLNKIVVDTTIKVAEGKELTYLEKIKSYQEQMGYTNRQRNTLLGYLSELENGDRNFYLRPSTNLVSMKKHKITEEEIHRIFQFRDYSGVKYKNGLRLGKVSKIHKSGKELIEVVSGKMEYEYEINNQKVKDKAFHALVHAEEYWKGNVKTPCGFIKISLDDQLVYSHDILSSEPREINIDLTGSTKLKIEASGEMVGVINPEIIKEEY